MKIVFSKNPVLTKDKYLENFLDYLRKNPSKLGKRLEDFSTQLKIDKKELESNILEQDPNKKDVKEALDTIANLNSLLEEDTKLLGDKKAKDNFFKKQNTIVIQVYL